MLSGNSLRYLIPAHSGFCYTVPINENKLLFDSIVGCCADDNYYGSVFWSPILDLTNSCSTSYMYSPTFHRP